MLQYTATTENATNKVTATPTEEGDPVVIMLGETEIENGTSATWETGENVLEITVDGETTYTVTVTKE